MEQKENESSGRVKRPDEVPGFWAEYEPPRSHVADAISYPIHEPDWAGRVVNAYLKDARRLKCDLQGRRFLQIDLQKTPIP